jgi:hypothetical protein
VLEIKSGLRLVYGSEMSGQKISAGMNRNGEFYFCPKVVKKGCSE